MYQQAENGKTELSLMHFTIKNPRWEPPQESSVFISHLKEKVHQDAQTGPSPQLLLSEAPLCTSLLSNESATGPDNLLASVLAHPVLTASGLPGRNRRFIPPSSAASAAASVLASLSSSQQPHAGRSRSHTLLPSRQHHDSTMYCSDHTVGDSMSASDSRVLSQSHSALASEFASAEMSLHAIYMHEVHQQKTQHPSGPIQASVPMKDLSTNYAQGPQIQSAQTVTLVPPTSGRLGGWAEEEEEEQGDEEEINTNPVPDQTSRGSS